MAAPSLIVIKPAAVIDCYSVVIRWSFATGHWSLVSGYWVVGIHRRGAEDAEINDFLFAVETRLPCLSSRWRAGDGKEKPLNLVSRIQLVELGALPVC